MSRDTSKARARAREVLVRRTDEKLAARLREHGWVCVPPEEVERAEAS